MHGTEAPLLLETGGSSPIRLQTNISRSILGPLESGARSFLVDQDWLSPFPNVAFDLSEHEIRDVCTPDAPHAVDRMVVRRTKVSSRWIVRQKSNPNNSPIQAGFRKKLFHSLLISNFVAQQNTEQHIARKPADICSCIVGAQRRNRQDAADTVLLHGWDDAAQR